MARYAYERLSALDNSFLVLETPHGCMHVASTGIFETGTLRDRGDGVDFEAIKRAMEAILHLIPRYRQKLQWIPFENHPVWVDDAGFNLNYHVRHTALPHPGSERQLKRLAARIMSQHLDRSKPLWETWVIEGLEGDRFAIVNKIHHCMIDGVSGVDLMAILMSPTPTREIPDAPPFVPRPAPTRAELVRGELFRRAALPVGVLRDVRTFAREAQDLRHEVEVRARALAETLGWTFRGPSDTPLNQPIGAHRRFDWTVTQIAEIREIRKALGGSLNDVVLATVAGAVRSFLQRRGVDPSGIDFRVLSPVSTRAETERGSLGNRVSGWIVALPIDEPDPHTRLDRVIEQTAALKESKQAVAAELLTRLADWTPARLLSLGARRATQILPFNMVVTNVPGPQMPLYVLEAKMLESYPSVPLTGRLGLGIALFSYDGKLCWGLNADWELIPDLHEFVGFIESSFRELRALAAPTFIRTDPGRESEEEEAENPPQSSAAG
jgi:WS/DGAT/MGAT family acyltransferase